MRNKGKGVKNVGFNWRVDLIERNQDGMTTKTFVAGGMKTTNKNGYRQWMGKVFPADVQSPLFPDAKASLELWIELKSGKRADSLFGQCFYDQDPHGLWQAN